MITMQTCLLPQQEDRVLALSPDDRARFDEIAAFVELELGDTPSRVHLLGRGRDGRLVRRAIISALTREGWDERWQRRASAS